MAFVVIVFAVVGVVVVRVRWWMMLQVAVFVSVLQAVAQIAQASVLHAGIVVFATVFWFLYLVVGLAFQLRVGPVLASASVSFLTGGVLFGGVSVVLLYNGTWQGIVLLVVGLVYLVFVAGLFRQTH